MNKYKNTLLFVAALGISTSSIVYAGNLTVINNIHDQRAQLCIREEGSVESTRKDCFGPTVESGEQITYSVTREHVGGIIHLKSLLQLAMEGTLIGNLWEENVLI